MNRKIFEILANSEEDKKLRPYQTELKKKIYDSYKDNGAILLQMPTGTGKTRLFVSILKDFHNYAVSQDDETRKAIRTLVLVHRVELLDQVYETLGVHYGLACGIIHSGERTHKRIPIQIASVQTLNKRIDEWKDYDFDFIIVDEAHHVPAVSYKNILDTFPDAYVLGVTATPYRLKRGEGFSSIFDKLIVSQSVNDFIKEGYLAKYKYYSVASYSHIQQMIDSIKKFNVAGDYDESELMKICNTDGIRAQIVETYEKYAKGKKGIVYTINQLHNIRLCENFRAKGYKVAAIDSKTPALERSKIVEDFKNSKIDIIFNVNIFSEGFDCPDIEFIQLARPTKSLALYLQQVGRGLRVANNKAECIFLDNVGSYNKFGFPSTPHDWRLYFEGNEAIEEFRPKRRSLDAKSDNKSLVEGYEKVHLIDVEDGISANSFDNKTFFVLDKLLKYWNEYIKYVDHLLNNKNNDEKIPFHFVKLLDCKPIMDIKQGFKDKIGDMDLNSLFDALSKSFQYDFRLFASDNYKEDGEEGFLLTSFGDKYVEPILERKISGTDLFNIRNFLRYYFVEELYNDVMDAVEFGDDFISTNNDFFFKWLVEIYSIVPQNVDYEYTVNLPVELLDYYMDVFGLFEDLYKLKRTYNTYCKKKADPEAGLRTEDSIV